MLSKSTSVHFNRRHVSNQKYGLLAKFLYSLSEACFLTFAAVSIFYQIRPEFREQRALKSLSPPRLVGDNLLFKL